MFWPSPTTDTADFESACRSRPLTLGEELPGSVWRSGAPGWIPDMSADPHLPRGPLAAKQGFRAAFAFPVALGKKVLGVIEFLNRDVLPPDETLLRVLGGLGRQIGLFLELKRTEEELAESARWRLCEPTSARR